MWLLTSSLSLLVLTVQGYFQGPCGHLHYGDLEAMFATADPATIDRTLESCADALLARRPERLSQRVCALAKLALRAQLPGALAIVLGHGRCNVLSGPPRMELERKAAEHGMLQHVQMLCSGPQMGGPMMPGMMQQQLYCQGTSGYGSFHPHHHPHYQGTSPLGYVAHGVGQAIGDVGYGISRALHGVGHGLERAAYGVGHGLNRAAHDLSGYPRHYPSTMMHGGTLPIDILATLTRHDAMSFGLSGECRQLTADHFSFPGVRPSVLRNLSSNCFQDLHPDCFVALSRRQIRAIQHWPLARPNQVAAISPHSIVAIPFDWLGSDPAIPGDASHPCAGVTPQHEAAIQPLFQKWSKYSERCLGVSPVPPGATPGWSGGWGGNTALYVILVLFLIVILVAAFW